MLFSKFGFQYDYVILEKENFDDYEELSYTIAFVTSTNSVEKMWVLRHSGYCALENLLTPYEFTSVISSNFALKVYIVHDIQAL